MNDSNFDSNIFGDKKVEFDPFGTELVKFLQLFGELILGTFCAFFY